MGCKRDASGAGASVVVALALLQLCCGGAEPAHGDGPDPLHDVPVPLPPEELGLVDRAAAPKPTQNTPVPPPELSAKYWPCSECHDETMPADPKRRVLTEDHKKIVLVHDEENRWCLDCHDADDRDQLRLASGAKIPFTESHRLCGQCHGPTYRDWKRGVHGKRTGMWNGEKKYLLCSHCHDPHAPRFKPLAPKPPPVRPEQIR